MKYLAKFDNKGVRETSIVEGIHFETDEEKQKYLDAGFVEITEEEQIMYASNEYIRGVDGNPQKNAPYMPTIEDIANQIAAQYQNQIADIKEALATAMLANDDDEISELRAEYADLLAEYEKELEAVAND